MFKWFRRDKSTPPQPATTGPLPEALPPAPDWLRDKVKKGELGRKTGKGFYEWKDGKAVKATMNWGDIEAPTLAKTALWSLTAADNQIGVLQGTIVEDINEFIGGKCDEVKSEWDGK